MFEFIDPIIAILPALQQVKTSLRDNPVQSALPIWGKTDGSHDSRIGINDWRLSSRVVLPAGDLAIASRPPSCPKLFRSGGTVESGWV